jgi:MFS family permease
MGRGNPMNALQIFYRDLTLKPQGIIVVIAAFLPIIAITAMGPAVPALIKYFAENPEARRLVPAMIGAPGLAMAIFAPFAGLLVDKFGRRRLLLASTLFYGVAGAAPFWLDDLDHIYYSRLALGVAEAGILTTVNTLIGDYWEDKGRKNWLFLQGILGPLISAFFSLIVGYASEMQWNGVFLVYLVAFPIWAAMLVWLFEPKKATASVPISDTVKPAKTPFPVASAVAIVATTFFSSMLYYVFIINGALIFAEVGVDSSAAYGKLIFIPSMFILVGAVLFRLLANKGSGLQIATFLFLLGGGLAAMGLATSVPMMIAALAVQQTAAGMAVPTLIAWAQSKYTFEHRGLGMGLWTTAFFLAQSQSPNMVHALNVYTGSMQGAFLTAGSVGVVAAVLVFIGAVVMRGGGRTAG